MLLRFLHPLMTFEGDDGSGGGSGGAGSEGGTGGSEGEGGGGEGGGDKTFTQAELDARAGQARAEGRTAAEKKLLADLGVDNLKDAKAILDAARERAESEKSEAQRATEAAQAKEAEAAERESAAALREHNVNVKDALRDEGVPKEKLDRVRKLVDVEVGADEAAIKAAVGEVKKDFPELFGQKGSGGSPDSDTGGSSGGTSTEATDAMERGRQRAKDTHKADEYAGLSMVQ